MAEKGFFKKIIEVQQELNAPKDRENKYGGFFYRSCGDILKALKPLLHERELILLLNDKVVFVEGRFYIQATATITDGKDSIETTAFAREMEKKTKMDEPQVSGVSSTYARKYALNGLLCIDDSENDPDSEHNYKNKSEKPTVKKPSWRAKARKVCKKETIEKLSVLLKNGSDEQVIKDMFETMRLDEFETVIENSKKITEVK